MNYNTLNCLTESNLLEYLKQIYPNSEWIYNKNFPGFKFKPDYRCEELKICVEYDGPKHYTCARTVIEDRIKTNVMQRAGYKVIRIPMYVQLDKQTIKALFNVNKNITNNYPHGFIAKTKTMVYPADFCTLGLERFHEELNDSLNCIEEQVYKSVFRVAFDAVEDYLHWSNIYLSKEQREEEQEIFDHVSTSIALKYMDYEILSQTMYNGGKYTYKFINE